MLIVVVSMLERMNFKKTLFVLSIVVIVLTGIAFSGCTTTTPPTTPQKQDLLIATTTSLYDTGLLDYLGGIFGPEYNANLRITAKGTGQALELGQN